MTNQTKKMKIKDVVTLANGIARIGEIKPATDFLIGLLHRDLDAHIKAASASARPYIKKLQMLNISIAEQEAEKDFLSLRKSLEEKNKTEEGLAALEEIEVEIANWIEVSVAEVSTEKAPLRPVDYSALSAIIKR